MPIKMEGQTLELEAAAGKGIFFVQSFPQIPRKVREPETPGTLARIRDRCIP